MKNSNYNRPSLREYDRMMKEQAEERARIIPKNNDSFSAKSMLEVEDYDSS